MFCNFNPGHGGASVGEIEQMGLLQDHVYSVLGFYESQDGQFRLVKIRNPWGKKEWNGPWSDGSAEWSDNPQVAKDLARAPTGGTPFGDSSDGVFFMCLEYRRRAIRRARSAVGCPRCSAKERGEEGRAAPKGT